MKRLKNLAFAVVLGTVLISALTVTAGAVVTESSGNGKALYDGVMLPNVDSVWDKGKYPYAFFAYVPSANACDLYFASSPFYVNAYEEFCSDGVFVEFAYDPNGVFVDPTSSWLFLDSGDVLYGLDVSGYVLWSSSSVLNSDGTTYLSASDSIPLDGMNVITWDGDTTGLESYGDNHIRVGDYVDFSSGIAVLDSGDQLLVTTDFYSEDSSSGLLVNGSVAAVISSPDVGLVFYYSSNGSVTYRTTLFAYPSSELPPDEGSDDIDFSGSSLHVVDVERSFDVLSYEVSWSDLPVVPYPDNVQYFIRGTLSDGSPTQSIYIGSSSDPPSGSVPVFFEFEDLSPSTEYTVTFELAYNTTASTNGPFTSSGVTVTDTSTTTSDSDISDGDKAIINAIDNASKDNQQWLDNQYNEAVGDLPEDTASTDAMIGDLDLKEEAYKNDAFDRFQELSSAFTGFDGDVASGIGLAGTLFSRFFNALGSYKIIYTFPLLLGLALVIIGRLGRSGGPRSGRDHEVPGQFKMDSW